MMGRDDLDDVLENEKNYTGYKKHLTRHLRALVKTYGAQETVEKLRDAALAITNVESRLSVDAEVLGIRFLGTLADSDYIALVIVGSLTGILAFVQQLLTAPSSP